MSEFGPADLTVVIPTRNRWDILRRTLAALAGQTVTGFDTLVVVDGTDQSPPPLTARTLVKEHGGPAAARNAGVAATSTPLVLFLGDDMIPTPGLVDAHLAGHARLPEPEAAVLGRAEWHPEVAGNAANAWIDRSGTQFDFPAGPTDDAGFGRFISSNVSLKRTLFDAAGGFDEAFVFAYEDLDFGWRLDQQGMRLAYAPEAKVEHLHGYDVGSLIRRWESIASGERLMAAKHSWFTPWFEPMARAAERARPVSGLWPRLDRRGPVPAAVARRVRARTDLWYLQQVAAHFINTWEGERGMAELEEYLGDRFDSTRLTEHRHLVDEEEHGAVDEHEFYMTSEAYLYDLTAFALWPTKIPYRRDLRALVGPGSRLLDYGCGIGADGLNLIGLGYDVSFADFDNPSTEYLRWRLKHRGSEAPVYDVEGHVPGGFDLAYSFDVIEHVDEPMEFLAKMEERAAIVMVNLLEPDPEDTHLHKDLPIGAILDHATRRGLLHYRKYHGRSHLIAYATHGGVATRARGYAARRLPAVSALRPGRV